MIADHSGSNGAEPVLGTPAASVVVGVLGEIALRRDGVLTALPGSRSRLLLVALALHPGRSRSAQGLIEDVWAEQPPRAPMNALHTQVSRLRSVLPEGALEIGPSGYRLALAPSAVDLSAAAELAQRSVELRALGDSAGCLELIAGARALWRDEPGADLPEGAVADELRAAAAARANELDAVELAVREDLGELSAALRIAHRRVELDPLHEPAQHTLMRLLAAAGRPNEALASFAAFRGKLAEELGADPGPALVALNTAILRGDALPGNGIHGGGSGGEHSAGGAASTSTAAPDAPSTLRYGLRAEPNALLGRSEDLDRLDDLLRDARVVTVLGPGGVGKTRVAHAVGLRSENRPVVLVELASVRGGSGGADAEAHTTAAVERAIGAALGLSEVPFDAAAIRAGQLGDFRARLHDALAARSMLLILDNCEHLIDAVAVVVADAVAAADRLSVLTTSRSPLMITAETVYPLPPLTIADTGSPATELFIARARAVRPGVRLDPVGVAELCRTLDGLPLAIELAAARVRTMGVEEINERLADRFALLRQGDRSSPRRHRTLHAVIDWSWNLLEPAQQVALTRLCRFPAGCTLSAAELVAGDEVVPDVAGAVDGLVNQSLLTVVEDETLGTRYRMLETVREFGAARLVHDATEAELVETRMRLWGKTFCEDAARRHGTVEQAQLVLTLVEESDNLLAVLHDALTCEDAVTAYTVFPVLGALLLIRGSHLEVAGWGSRIVRLEPSAADLRQLMPDLVVLAYTTACLHTFFMNRDLREISRLRSRIRRLLESPEGLSQPALLLGRIVSSRMDGKAVGRLLADAAHHTDEETRAIALMIRANIRENVGDVYGSTRDAQLALDLVAEGKVWTVAMIRRHLGMVCSQVADFANAVGHYRFALGMLKRVGAYEDTVETRCALVAALAGLGELSQAREELESATGTVDLAVEGVMQHNELLAVIAQTEAELLLAEGAVDAGLDGYRRALKLCGWPGDRTRADPSHRGIAAGAVDAHVLHGRAGEVGELVGELIAESVPELRRYQDLPQVGMVACAVGSYLVATDVNRVRGLELLILAANVVARQDFPSMRLIRHLDSAVAAAGSNRVAAARERFGRVRRWHSMQRILQIMRELSPTP